MFDFGGSLGIVWCFGWFELVVLFSIMLRWCLIAMFSVDVGLIAMWVACGGG